MVFVEVELVEELVDVDVVTPPLLLLITPPVVDMEPVPVELSLVVVVDPEAEPQVPPVIINYDNIFNKKSQVYYF